MSISKRVPMAAPNLQYRAHREEIDAAVHAVLDGGQYYLGPECRKLEGEIADLCGATFGLGVNSGTDALALALAALGVVEGDEVITSSFTFFATAEVISNLGAVPVFCDIDPYTFNLDPNRVEASITDRTRAIMPVHLFGQMADMAAFADLARRYDLALVEDAAQSLGSVFQDRPAGSYGDATGISFFPTKNLGACGDAGMIVTSREEIAEQIRLLRFHGSGGGSVHHRVGVNSRLDDVQAAILRVKLRRLEESNGRRQLHARRYDEALRGTFMTPPYRDPRASHIYHQYTIRTPHRDDLHRYLDERGIDSRIYYSIPLHRQPVYAELGYEPGVLRQTEKASREVLSLPVFPEMTDSQQDQVIESLFSFYRSR